ncbi:MAG: dethiobiotin synthase [Rhodospirillaceae bacterium]|nr:MAG: dethiobiotin synthase [Rhodospirillaceae bacterium]
MPAWFVTGTGTDVGKTFVTQALARHLRRRGHSVDARKPIVSGFDPRESANSDSGILLKALERPLTDAELHRISPWRFKAPLSPDMAAAREGRTIPFDALVAHSRQAVETCAPAGALFIEGVGGIMVPIDAQHTVLDWMRALRLPVIVVAGSYLGTISHTLTAVDVLRRSDLVVTALVVSETAGSPVPLADTVAAIARFINPIKVIGLPRLAGPATEHPAFGDLAATLL